MIFYLICSFSSAAMTIGENGNNSAAFVPDSNLVSQLVIWLVILQAEDRWHFAMQSNAILSLSSLLAFTSSLSSESVKSGLEK